MVNFYWQSIQDYNKIAILLISILKIKKLLNKPVFGKNNSSQPIFNKKNDNNKIDRFSVSGDNIKYVKIKSQKNYQNQEN